ncbi:hypothetical protein AAF712_010798 [Marasmius tenuissimus]|uniref:Uncharacterized protein n=1 Tax=Marasmius tenuissimus TaxID=585030 RepID=A0ABR2ZM91_9AGAR
MEAVIPATEESEPKREKILKEAMNQKSKEGEDCCKACWYGWDGFKGSSSSCTARLRDTSAASAYAVLPPSWAVPPPQLQQQRDAGSSEEDGVKVDVEAGGSESMSEMEEVGYEDAPEQEEVPPPPPPSRRSSVQQYPSTAASPRPPPGRLPVPAPIRRPSLLVTTLTPTSPQPSPPSPSTSKQRTEEKETPPPPPCSVRRPSRRSGPPPPTLVTIPTEPDIESVSTGARESKDRYGTKMQEIPEFGGGKEADLSLSSYNDFRIVAGAGAVLKPSSSQPQLQQTPDADFGLSDGDMGPCGRSSM